MKNCGLCPSLSSTTKAQTGSALFLHLYSRDNQSSQICCWEKVHYCSLKPLRFLKGRLAGQSTGSLSPSWKALGDLKYNSPFAGGRIINSTGYQINWRR